jgi:hypothetical protein
VLWLQHYLCILAATLYSPYCHCTDRLAWYTLRQFCRLPGAPDVEKFLKFPLTHSGFRVLELTHFRIMHYSGPPVPLDVRPVICDL